jgi:hypothetical protein
MGVGRDALITFHTTWKPLQGEGYNHLMTEVMSERYRLVVVDTIGRAIPGLNQAKDDALLGKIFGDLQSLALRHSTAIAIIDHTRKPNGILADPIDDIISVTAKTAIADCILALYKEQGKAGATLRGRGRDIEEIDLRLFWDPLTRCWQCEGNSAAIELTAKRQEILDALETLGKVKAPAVAKYTGRNRSNVFRDLNDLYNAGVIGREVIGENVFFFKKSNT